jgi:hypothetical protein
LRIVDFSSLDLIGDQAVSSRPVSRALLTLTLCTIIFAPTSSTRAQDPIETGKKRQDLSVGASSVRLPRTTPPKQIYVTKTNTVTVTKIKRVTPTTGTLSVASEPEAALLIEPMKRGSEGKRGTIPAGDRQFVFNELKPGRYRVAASLEGYESVEGEVIIAANKTSTLTLNLKPVTQNVTINTNIKTGEIRYAPVETIKDARTDDVRYIQRDVSRVVPIQNGRAVLANLRKGTYGLDIRSEEVEYQTLLATITVPGEENLNANLNRTLSTKTFYAAWTHDEWDLPADWHLGSHLLPANGRGVALPHDEGYRYYKDFQLSSDVRMRNGVAVSFVLRAADTQNYYLVQLTGEQAREPYYLRGFVVKKGERQLLQSIPINHIASTIKPKQFFKVNIKMTGNSMNISVEDSQTGASLPLGILTDAYQKFPIGAVGIAAEDGEQSDYGSFMVCTPECPKP